MTETVSILPTGIFNSVFQRRGLNIEAIIADDAMGLIYEGTPDQLLGSVIDELALLDVTLHMNVRNIAERLDVASRNLRDLFVRFDDGVDNDDLDDVIAEVQHLAYRLKEIMADYDMGFYS